ncbi:MAG TPA: hypothetical protein DCZ80_02085 [Legionellales bacterium]|nr:hypothetical protein [Legionellales bacterium]
MIFLFLSSADWLNLIINQRSNFMFWKFVLFFTAILGLYFGFKFLFSTFKTYEEPIYRMIFRQKPYEIREYEEMMVVASDQTGSRKRGIREGFKLLFAYISGANAAKQKISMTTPVMQIGTSDFWTVEFVLPRYLGDKDIPRPTHTSVKIKKIQKGRYAVIRFSGLIREKQLNQKLEDLKLFIIQHDCKIKHSPIFAFYDPPWTPSFLKRNEIWIQVEDDCQK